MNAACPYALYLGRLAPNSQRSIASQLNSIAEILNWPEQERQERFHHIDYQQASHIKAILLSKGWSARSINRAMTAIRNIVKVAAMTGLATDRQVTQLSAISKVKHGSHKGSPLTPEQVNALFTALEADKRPAGKRNIAIISVLLGVGLRRSEVVSLRYADYCPQHQTLYIRNGKGNKSRTVFLPDWSTSALKDWLTLRGALDGHLFLRISKSGHVQTNSQLSDSFIYSLIRKTLETIGIEGVSPHDLRRTFITRLLEQDVDLNTVRQMAGHADIATTIMYDKRDQAAMRHAANRLSYKKEGE